MIYNWGAMIGPYCTDGLLPWHNLGATGVRVGVRCGGGRVRRAFRSRLDYGGTSSVRARLGSRRISRRSVLLPPSENDCG